MPWVRFDDNTPDNPKIDALSDGAFRLWFGAICYSNRNLTDGFVPAARVARLAPHYKPAHQAELIEAGCWHKEQDGVRIHDYLDSQPSAREIHERREYEREKKARQRSAGAKKSDRDPDSGQYVSHRDNQRDTYGDGPRDDDRESPRESNGESPATQPNPTQPVSKSSSSEPHVATPREEEEEDEAMREARRRLGRRNGPELIDPAAWLATTAQRLRNEHYQPPAPAEPRSDCGTCDNLGVIETPSGYTPCLECSPSNARRTR